MQRLINYLPLVPIALAGLPANADRIVGNGGDLVTCDRNGIITHHVLDIYEAEHLRGMQPDFGTPADPNDHYSIANTILERVLAVDPERGTKYLKWLTDFPQESRILYDQTFDDIQDSDISVRQNHCRKLDQIAVQRTPLNPEDARYLINGDLWDQLDQEPEQRAALIVHEIVYRDAIERGHINSVATRYLVGLITWKDFATRIDADAWRERLRSNDFDVRVFLDTTYTPREYKFVHFDGADQTYQEARETCQALGNNSGLPDIRDFSYYGDTTYSAWKESGIGRTLLARQLSVEIWLDGGEVLPFGRTFSPQHAPSSDRATVVCWIQD